MPNEKQTTAAEFETLDDPLAGTGEHEQIAPVALPETAAEPPNNGTDAAEVVAEKKEYDRKAAAAAARILAEQTGTTVAAAAERLRKEPALIDKAIEALQQLKADLS